MGRPALFENTNVFFKTLNKYKLILKADFKIAGLPFKIVKETIEKSQGIYEPSYCYLLKNLPY